jgi:hypothetical protein
MATINVNEKVGTPTDINPVVTLLFAAAHASIAASASFKVTRDTPATIVAGATAVTIQIDSTGAGDWVNLVVLNSDNTSTRTGIVGGSGNPSAQSITSPGIYRVNKLVAVAGGASVHQ